ncbi:hypothetical protein PSEUDO8Z_10034 [Pseudomonas sp. 8Z]|nr:hypothetical protein PSEUDO8Z_10034 [Pseudomonas sp. 8Z]
MSGLASLGGLRGALSECVAVVAVFCAANPPYGCALPGLLWEGLSARASCFALPPASMQS